MSIQLYLNNFEKLKLQYAVSLNIMNEIFILHHSTAIESSSLTMEESRC